MEVTSVVVVVESFTRIPMHWVINPRHTREKSVSRMPHLYCSPKKTEEGWESRLFPYRAARMSLITGPLLWKASVLLDTFTFVLYLHCRGGKPLKRGSALRGIPKGNTLTGLR